MHELNPQIGDDLTVTTEADEVVLKVEDVDGDSIYGIGADGFDYLLRTLDGADHLYVADADDSDWTLVGRVTDVIEPVEA